MPPGIQMKIKIRVPSIPTPSLFGLPPILSGVYNHEVEPTTNMGNPTMSKLFGRGMEKLSKKNIQPKPDRQGPQN